MPIDGVRLINLDISYEDTRAAFTMILDIW